MKTLKILCSYIFTISIILISVELHAQAPDGLNYQAVARDASGNLISNQNIDVRFIIKQTTSSGATIYEESHATSTNQYGLFSLVIGNGSAMTGNFSTIDWESDAHFLRVDIDAGGGFVNMGTEQLQSVPYSLFANKSNKAVDMELNELNDVSAPSPANGNVLKWNGSDWNPAGDNVNDADSDPANEMQSLTLTGNTLAISGGNNIDLSSFDNVWSTNSNDAYYDLGDVGVGVSDPITGFHVADNTRVLFGVDTVGAGDKLMFLPDLHAFRVGTIATGAASTYWNPDSIGLYSFASGLNTRAQGFGATAMGRDTEATNSYAFASGFFSNADGQYSTAMGFNTDAFALGSTALGYSTDAEQNYSFAAGYFAEAQAIYSVAIGNAVRAQSYASMAVGRYNVGGGSATSWLSSDPIFEVGIGTGPSTRANAITVRKNGNVGIGTTIPLDALHVNGRVRLQTVEYFEDGGTSEIAARGDIRPSSDNTYDIGTSSMRYDDVFATSGVVNTSDRNDKKNIVDLNYGLQDVLNLRPVSY
ncbi:MAG: hypothetical protein HKN22_07455, partial [Bacteroidia bacterium]|nr:hypothetical protein [Bacteroidia bacterium]